MNHSLEHKENMFQFETSSIGSLINLDFTFADTNYLFYNIKCHRTRTTCSINFNKIVCSYIHFW